MKKKILIPVGFAFLALFINSVYAQYRVNEKNEIIEDRENGSINWSNNRISAKGCAESDQSLFNQKIAAEVAARANLLKVLDGVQISSERVVRDGRTKGVINTEKVEGFLKHSRVSEPEKNSIGLLEVTAYVNVDKKARILMLPDAYFHEEEEYDDYDFSTSSENTSLYTGIIIDASNLKVKPAMLPGLFDEDGRVIYSPSPSDKSSILENGFAGYTGSLDKAKMLKDRVGEAPLIIKAEKASSDGINLYLDNNDARKVLDAEKISRVLSDCRVMIVINNFTE